MSVMGFLQKGIVPVDPLTTKMLDAAPKPVRTIANPAGEIARRALSQDQAAALLDPLKLGNETTTRKQAKSLLNQG
jgi:hypothetical protein